MTDAFAAVVTISVAILTLISVYLLQKYVFPHIIDFLFKLFFIIKNKYRRMLDLERVPSDEGDSTSDESQTKARRESDDH